LTRRVFLAVAGAGLIRAQDTTFSAGVKVVNVLATVHDKSGKIISSLTKDDFELMEDGHPQTIGYFSRETDVPLTLGLLVDTSMSQRAVLGEERTASYRFLQKVLREDRDSAFLIHFDFEVELLQDLTSSREKLEKALDQIGLPRGERPQMRRPGEGRGGGGGGRGRFGTTLYDAILLASNEIMKPRQGRKALILLTDGRDSASKVPLSEAIEAAQRADTLVYSIYFAGQQPEAFRGRGGGRGRRRFFQTPQQRPDGKKILQRISEETGGAFFEVSKKLTVDQIYDRIQEDLRNQYSLGYPSTGTGNEFRKIKVTVKKKDLTVQAREGYYPGRTP
jgi:VWFA-related protein